MEDHGCDCELHQTVLDFLDLMEEEKINLHAFGGDYEDFGEICVIIAKGREAELVKRYLAMLANDPDFDAEWKIEDE